MTEVNVPIGLPVVKNIDGSLVEDNSSRLIDGYLDRDGNINSRPGLLSVANFTSQKIEGLFWWDKVGKLIVVSNGIILSVAQDYSSIALSGTGTMQVETRPTFATDDTYVYMANGGKIIKTDSSTPLGAALITDGDAPVLVTHIINIDGYLLANKVNSQTFYFAALEDPSTWSALDFATAGGKPDVVVAIHEFEKEIYIFGKESLELWENDGETPFSRVNGGFKNTGCIAPYSVVFTDDACIWLSSGKRFVKYSGGSVEGFSTDFDTTIDEMGVVSDCIADRIDICGRTFIKFTFPTENRTLVYNVTENNWCESGYWNSNSGAHDRFIGNCHAFSPTWNKHFWGSSRENGYLYLMSSDYNTDNGNQIRMQQVTGNISYGTNNRKQSESLIIKAKRGRTASLTETPLMTLRINDDGKGWSNEIELSLGAMGDYRNFIKKENLGTYRSRQYEFTVTDNVGVAFGHGKENIFVGND